MSVGWRVLRISHLHSVDPSEEGERCRGHLSVCRAKKRSVGGGGAWRKRSVKVVGIEVDTADSAGASGGGELGRDGARQSPYCYFYLQQHRASNTLFYKHNDG